MPSIHQKEVAESIEPPPLKMKNASQVCCLATRPGDLLSLSLTNYLVQIVAKVRFFSIRNTSDGLFFIFPDFFTFPIGWEAHSIQGYYPCVFILQSFQAVFEWRCRVSCLQYIVQHTQKLVIYFILKELHS